MRHQCLCKIMQKSVSKYGVQLNGQMLNNAARRDTSASVLGCRL